MKNDKQSRKPYLIFSILLVSLLIIPTNLHAKSKKIPNCLKSIVVFSTPPIEGLRKRTATGTGFITKYKEDLVVVTNLDIIYHTLKPTIKTIDGNKLKYSKILIPGDKRNLIFFVLDPKTPEDIYQTLELDEDVTSDTDIGDKVLSFGCKSNWETITSSKGKISGIGSVKLEIKGKAEYNMNGGPIISYNNGKVIGVLSKLMAMFNKKATSKYSQGTRIDSIKELKTLSEEEFSEDLKRLSVKENLINSIEDKYADFSSEIDKLSEKIDSGYGTAKAAISKLQKKHQGIVRKLNAIVAQMDQDNTYSMQYFKIRHRHVVTSAEKVINKFIELDKRFEELQEQNANAAEKNKLRGTK